MAARARLSLASKAELRSALECLRAEASGIRRTALGTVDCRGTYLANVHEPPADPVLPGFGPAAFPRDAESALARFKHFCRSQYGQRQAFVLKFDAQPAATGKALAPFDGGPYGDGYLTLHTGLAVASAPPPCDPEGWAFGALVNGTCGWFPPTYVAWVRGRGLG